MSDPVIIAIVASIATALAFGAKTIWSLVQQKRPSSRPPPSMVKTPHVSGQMRAVTASVLEKQQLDVLHQRVGDIHGVVMSKDADGFYRGHNKASVERAILESRDYDRQAVELLKELLMELRQNRTRMPTLREDAE